MSAKVSVQKDEKSLKPLSSSSASAARAQAAELRFSQLKERHAELITSHADLMKKVKTLFFCTR